MRGGASSDSIPRMIKIGDALPDATLNETTEFGPACPLSPKPVSAAEAAKGKKVVIFGLPGAYTPTCSAKHLPGYLTELGALKARGVDEVWCVSVNDAYVMAAWGREQGAIGKVRMDAVSRSILVFYIPMLVVLALVTYVPALTLWLPSVLLR